LNFGRDRTIVDIYRSRETKKEEERERERETIQEGSNNSRFGRFLEGEFELFPPESGPGGGKETVRKDRKMMGRKSVFKANSFKRLVPDANKLAAAKKRGMVGGETQKCFLWAAWQKRWSKEIAKGLSGEKLGDRTPREQQKAQGVSIFNLQLDASQGPL